MSNKKTEKLRRNLAQYYQKYLKAKTKEAQEKAIKKWDQACIDSRRFTGFEDWVCALDASRQRSIAEMKIIQTLCSLAESFDETSLIIHRIRKKICHLEVNAEAKIFWLQAQEKIQVLEELLETLYDKLDQIAEVS